MTSLTVDGPAPGHTGRVHDSRAIVVTPQRRARNLRFLVAAVGFAYVLYSGYVFTQQRDLIRNQERLQRSLVGRAIPVLDAATPLTQDALRRQETTQARLREAARLVRETRPLVAELRPLAQETTPLVRDLRQVGLPEAVRDTAAAARVATTDDRLARALDATVSTFAEVRRRDLLRRLDELARRAERDLPRLVELQTEALAVQRRTLAVQEEALVRIRSIDQKTGGTAPTAVPAAVPAAGG